MIKCVLHGECQSIGQLPLTLPSCLCRVHFVISKCCLDWLQNLREESKICWNNTKYRVFNNKPSVLFFRKFWINTILEKQTKRSVSLGIHSIFLSFFFYGSEWSFELIPIDPCQTLFILWTKVSLWQNKYLDCKQRGMRELAACYWHGLRFIMRDRKKTWPNITSLHWDHLLACQPASHT